MSSDQRMSSLWSVPWRQVFFTWYSGVFIALHSHIREQYVILNISVCSSVYDLSHEFFKISMGTIFLPLVAHWMVSWILQYLALFCEIAIDAPTIVPASAMCQNNIHKCFFHHIRKSAARENFWATGRKIIRLLLYESSYDGTEVDTLAIKAWLIMFLNISIYIRLRWMLLHCLFTNKYYQMCVLDGGFYTDCSQINTTKCMWYFGLLLRWWTG